MDIREFETDENKEKVGAWVEIEDGLDVLVRRMFNPEFERFVASRAKGRRARIDAQGTSSPLMIEAIAETVLLDWKGFTDKTKIYKWTKERGHKMLQQREFRNMVVLAATETQNFWSDEQQADLKN